MTALSRLRRAFWSVTLVAGAAATLLSGSGCETSAVDTRVADSLAKASLRTFDGFLKQFHSDNLPVTIPDPAVNMDTRDVIDQGYLELALIGQGKIFETKPDGALIYYSKLNYSGRFVPLVMAIQKGDGMHWHLCTFTPEGKAIDEKEIAFKIIGKNLSGERKAVITPDLRVAVTERTTSFTILTPEQMQALRTDAVVRESVSTRNEAYQVMPDGKISEAGWQRPDEPKADSVGNR